MIVELLEKVSLLNFKHIREMSVPEFRKTSRQIYLHELATMYGYDIHFQTIVLEYLCPMLGDMLELTRNREAELKKKSDMLSP